MKERTKESIEAAVMVALFFALAVGISAIPATESYAPIYSLGDGSQMHGSFILWTGTIKSESMYIFYVQTRDGGYYKESIPDSAMVYMDQNDNPFLKTKLWMNMPMQYELHVPKGTITKQYSLGVNN